MGNALDKLRTVGDLAFCRSRLAELRASALMLDDNGDVVGFDPDVWAQANALGDSIGEGVGDILSLMRHDGRWSAWLYYPEWVLRWRQPESWEACCRLYAADVAERALDLRGGDVDPRSREAIRVARLHARGLASDTELEAARAAARTAAWAAVGDAAWAARTAAEAAVGDAVGDAAWAAAEDATWDAAWTAAEAAVGDAAEAADRRIQWRRLLQYICRGVDAAGMEWEVQDG